MLETSSLARALHTSRGCDACSATRMTLTSIAELLCRAPCEAHTGLSLGLQRVIGTVFSSVLCAYSESMSTSMQ